MTYHNKILLRRIFKIILLILIVVAILLLIGFSYLSRYLVFSEAGARFSFHQDTAATSQASADAAAIGNAVLTTGVPVERPAVEVIETEAETSMLVNGILIDYDTLAEGTTLNTIELSENYNTIVLEMRREGSEILKTDSVKAFMSRATSQGIQLRALISCLDDSDFALSNPSEALQITGGALWVGANGTYYLNPSSAVVQEHMISLINQLQEMGFTEVILENFNYPHSALIVNDTGGASRDDLLSQAFTAIRSAVSCPIGLLISSPDVGHQALYEADRLYVFYENGSALQAYQASHPDDYLVFLTNSHDTRFDAYGKLTVYSKLSDTTADDISDPEPEATAEEDGEADEEDAEPYDEEPYYEGDNVYDAEDETYYGDGGELYGFE